ncbi:thiolase family protein [Paenibacillus albiflavus]|uniref:acetyl-CoA C-acetyltransferase n=1 Tax=Paenibacillus albiflavus TaxID=2545760 RepID=A0A4R4EAK5_9BACL|nr:thiolase family protein [Paenibacillus albiflavus]TCZ76307.1 thiolase family protein [Paenibacillus albiflavus]
MVVIVNALRTAIGKYGGALAATTPEDMAATVMRNNLALSACRPDIVDEIIIGQTKQSAHTPNIARVASLIADFPKEVSAYTVHRQCGSGMQAVHNAYMAIRTGQSEVVLAGGVESMSQAPYYMVGGRFGMNAGNTILYDSNTESQPRSQPIDKYGSFVMGETAEYLANKYEITREEQDEFAYRSQLKAKRAIEAGQFHEEIVPIEVKEGKNGVRLFASDEFPRETSVDKLAKLTPVFQKDGSVTAGNSTGRNDGASMLLMMSEAKALSLGLTPLAIIRGIGTGGTHPMEMGLGPIPASIKALRASSLTMQDMGLIELNEAFAAQSLAVIKEWGITEERVNVNGGAIALGHPLGCTGARILTTLVHEMHKRDIQYGLATLCIAGGQGIATVVERWKS